MDILLGFIYTSFLLVEFECKYYTLAHISPILIKVGQYFVEHGKCHKSQSVYAYPEKFVACIQASILWKNIVYHVIEILLMTGNVYQIYIIRLF